MQDYVYFQSDNSSSVNFVEKTVELVLRVMKNQESADNLDGEELDLLTGAVELIIEILQGPCRRNQLFCSVSGLVEQVGEQCSSGGGGPTSVGRFWA